MTKLVKEFDYQFSQKFIKPKLFKQSTPSNYISNTTPYQLY